jgi:hypothetical protein
MLIACSPTGSARPTSTATASTPSSTSSTSSGRLRPAAARRSRPTSGKENFLLFGEAFDGDDALVGSYTLPGRLDSVFYFSQKFQVFATCSCTRRPDQQDRGALRPARTKNYGTAPQEGGIGVAPTTPSSTSSTTTTSRGSCSTAVDTARCALDAALSTC